MYIIRISSQRAFNSYFSNNTDVLSYGVHCKVVYFPKQIYKQLGAEEHFDANDMFVYPADKVFINTYCNRIVRKFYMATLTTVVILLKQIFM